MMAKVVLIDTRWLDHEGLKAFYHPTCVQEMAKFYKWPNPGLRYHPYHGPLALGTRCDFCRKPVLFTSDNLEAADQPA